MKGEILVIGASILDVLARPVDEKVFCTGSSPVESVILETGGDALNEATVLAKLGKKVELLTVLGKDRAGRTIREHCREQGISLNMAVTEEEVETGINIVLVKENGERSFLTNPRGTLRALAMKHIPRKFPEYIKIVSFASIFVFPEMGDREMAETFRRIKSRGILLCADMTKRKNGETVEDIRESLSYVDYLFPNREEAALVTGKDYVEDMADAFLNYGVKNVVIKCGAEGCFVQNREESFQVPAVPGISCVDTTGAGDSFAGGFLCALSEGKSLKECAEFANACGALAVQKMGATAGISDRKQVDDLIHSTIYG